MTTLSEPMHMYQSAMGRAKNNPRIAAEIFNL